MAFDGRESSSWNPSPNSHAHFFKVILPPTLEDKKLVIPKKFVKKFGVELSAVVKLLVPNGFSWPVGLTKDGESMWFSDGWHDFVELFSICAGHFLVFRYAMDSSFHVIIFDQSGCEIQYPNQMGGPEKCPNFSSKLYTPSLQHKNPFVQTPDAKRTRKHDKSDKSTGYEAECKTTRSTAKGKRKLMTDEGEREISTANAIVPSNHICKVILQPSYLGTLYLPVGFSKEHLNEFSGLIKLQLSHGKQWPVRCTFVRHRALLCKGWRTFVLENHLRAGDVCSFEKLRSTDSVLQVTLHARGSKKRANQASLGSLVKHEKCQQSAISSENPKYKLGVDIYNKRGKVDAVGVDSSDYKRIKSCGLGSLDFLKDMGITVGKALVRAKSKDIERAIAAAKLFKPKNPSFMVILLAHNLKSRRLFVPHEFARTWFRGEAKCIKVQDFSGRESPVTITWYGSCYCLRDLSGLIKEMDLVEGDICLFEQITANHTLRVSVSHASRK